MNKIGMRADSTDVVAILNPKYDNGVPIMGDSSRLQKDLEYRTSTCKMGDCEGIGRYDARGEIICEDCGCVISGSEEASMFGDKYTGGSANQSSSRNRGASGHPLMRVQSLRDPGPSGDDSAGGVS